MSSDRGRSNPNAAVAGIELFYQSADGRLRIAASWAAIASLGRFKQLGMGV